MKTLDDVISSFELTNEDKAKLQSEGEPTVLQKLELCLNFPGVLDEEAFSVIRKELRLYLLSLILAGAEPFETSVEFQGYGDSGQIETPTGNVLLDEFFSECLNKFVHFDWYNNEGGGGDITWNLEDDKIVINGYYNQVQEVTEMDGVEV
jgi:hypothetical protein